MASGQRLRASSTGLPADRRTWRPRARRRRRSAAARRAVRLGADQRLVGQADAHRADPRDRGRATSSAARRLDAIPCSHCRVVDHAIPS